MEAHIVKILGTYQLTHDVKQFKLEKPREYDFVPGQATEISINANGWKDEGRPFTFTSLPDWDHLEFTIKIYDGHAGVTHRLGKLGKGDELILHDVFGAIQYHGKGTFIAGGAGVTPFISIFRYLMQQNKLAGNTLIFSNKEERDIILKDEFMELLGSRFINTITRGETTLYERRKIDRQFLSEKVQDFSQYFYLCGPDKMVEDLHQALLDLGAEKDKIVTEEF